MIGLYRINELSLRGSKEIPWMKDELDMLRQSYYTGPKDWLGQNHQIVCCINLLKELIYRLCLHVYTIYSSRLLGSQEDFISTELKRKKQNKMRDVLLNLISGAS